MWHDRRVLITGGSGFLGRHLVRHLLAGGVRCVTVLARDEKKHYELRHLFTDDLARLKSVIGDVRDIERLRETVAGQDIIIHAAAMKHITHCEEAPGEAYRTNIGGAENLIRVAQPSQRIVYISTDKAVAPANVYGATKMIQEGLFRAARHLQAVGVRYGNVLSSTGSVVPFFRALAQAGKSLPVTHPDMTRFLVPVQEALRLIRMGVAVANAEPGVILVPIPRSARISDIATVFAEQYGVDWTVTAPRPGEKLHESLLSERDVGLAAEGDGVVVIHPPDGGFAGINRSASRIDFGRFVSSGPVMSQDELKAFLETEGEL